MEDLKKHIFNIELSNICCRAKIELLQHLYEVPEISHYLETYDKKIINNRKTRRLKKIISLKYAINHKDKRLLNFKQDNFFPYFNISTYNGINFIRPKFPTVNVETNNSTSLYFEMGKIMIVGLKSIEPTIKKSLQKIANATQKVIKLKELNLINMVANFKIPSSISFKKMILFFRKNNKFFYQNMSVFPGYFTKIFVPKESINMNDYKSYYESYREEKYYRLITVLMFMRGNIIILGNRDLQDFRIGQRMLLGFCIHFSNTNQQEIEIFKKIFNFQSLDWYKDVLFLKSVDDSVIIEKPKIQREYLLNNIFYKKTLIKPISKLKVKNTFYNNFMNKTFLNIDNHEKNNESSYNICKNYIDSHFENKIQNFKQDYTNFELVKNKAIVTISSDYLKKLNPNFPVEYLNSNHKILMINKEKFKNIMTSWDNAFNHNQLCSYKDKNNQNFKKNFIINNKILLNVLNKILNTE